ncbi:ArdC family protein [Methylobacterium iners]|uniref:DNA primase TraC n=1 Tax=Methylobacterium iners TaxID=418707 RepID=A0ABQ4RW51_9HYPH|nr:zincin-like metallopeptidase domain-containing protein [Methylobacterium iners]GJD94432.1 DNA primase TraC [Methylobacterium iners]
MARPATDRATQPERTNLYREITDRIIAQLEAGCVPWVQPWGSGRGTVAVAMPRNAATARAYSGINVMLLWAAGIAAGYRDQRWLTFRQALSLGGCVRKGEHGTGIVYADRFTPKDERRWADRDGDAARQVAFLKRFTVFNVAQVDGLPANFTAPLLPPREDLVLPRFRMLMEASGVTIRVGGGVAFYRPCDDVVVLPPPEAFHEPINFHRTAAHELSHATGHRSRLDRSMKEPRGGPCYAREELVAEISAAYVCASLGIVPTVRHADYISAWLQVLRDDERAIVRAASHASKAADWLLDRLALAEESSDTAVNDGEGTPISVTAREKQHMQGRAA